MLSLTTSIKFSNALTQQIAGIAFRYGVRDSTPKKTFVTSSPLPKVTLATPYTRKIAKELKVNIDEVIGTGKWGRVEEHDIREFIATKGKKQGQKVEEPKEFKLEKYIKIVPENIEKVSSKASKEDSFFKIHEKVKCSQSATFIPQITYNDEICLDGLMNVKGLLDKQMKSDLDVMSFFIKAASLAMNDYPFVNSILGDDKQTVVVRKNHSIGVALNSPLGVVIQSVKNAQEKTLFQLNEDLKQMRENVKKGILEEDAEPSFVISNLGGFGGLAQSPSSVAILGIGKTEIVPRYNEKKEVVPRTVCGATFCADPRVIDGAMTAKFGNMLCTYATKPEIMLLHVK